ncbi:MAG: IclR family transcriptional regulator [Peptococcaceae bacterium]|nr:IclR family transcriptional regulator [Peptococcaceae bacterium]
MKLKEKTHKKFLEFFNEKCRVNSDGEFEMAFSEIQRSTGTASVTLKRALQTLVEEGVISMDPGRNSRYARFTVLNCRNTVPETAAGEHLADENMSLTSIEQEIDLLKRRIRCQELAIALLQDRIANLEDKLIR